MYALRAERPLNPNILAILGALHAVTTKLGFPYFLVGATARDVLMTHVFGLEVQRATHDVDFAIALEDWRSFDALKSALLPEIPTAFMTTRFPSWKHAGSIPAWLEQGCLDRTRA